MRCQCQLRWDSTAAEGGGVDIMNRLKKTEVDNTIAIIRSEHALDADAEIVPSWIKFDLLDLQVFARSPQLHTLFVDR